jgi:hypothetical protein
MEHHRHSFLITRSCVPVPGAKKKASIRGFVSSSPTTCDTPFSHSLQKPQYSAQSIHGFFNILSNTERQQRNACLTERCSENFLDFSSAVCYVSFCGSEDWVLERIVPMMRRNGYAAVSL